MKLYLSSYRFPKPEELLALFSKPIAECQIAVIPNAKDYQLPDERAQSLDEVTDDLAKIGLKSTVVDLREFDDGDALIHALNQYDGVWVTGGNAFILRSEMRRSGFNTIINKLTENGLIYGGESAGAIVAGLTLQGAEKADEPELADQVIWEGLGLTERILAPHADNPIFIEYINHMKKIYKNNERVMYLNDDQALIINS